MSKIKPQFSRGQILRYKRSVFHCLILATPEHCQHHGAPAYMIFTSGSDKVGFYTQTYVENGDWYALPPNEVDEIRHRFYSDQGVEVPHENRRVNIPSFMFGVGQCIRHKKSGGLYTVIMGPDVARLEATNTPAYFYQSLDTGLVWARCRDEIEDGRFEEVV
jgi:hypothetical protein